MCMWRVFWVYKKVAGSGGVVIQERGFSMFDTHEPAIAMPLSPYSLDAMNLYPHRNQIFLVGRHQEVRRFATSPELHHASQQSLRDVVS